MAFATDNWEERWQVALAKLRQFAAQLAHAWRSGADWLIPIFVALAMTGMAHIDLFRISDGMVFDFITTREPARKPRVIIIDQDVDFARQGKENEEALARAALALGVKQIAFMAGPERGIFLQEPQKSRIILGHSARRIPGRQAWQLAPNAVGGSAIADTAGHAARTVAAPEYGIYRRQLAWMNGIDKPVPVIEAAAAQTNLSAQLYYVRTPRAQNVPRISASQLIRGDLVAGELNDMIALVPPRTEAKLRKYATALGSGELAMSAEEYSAYAIQTLADGRAVLPLRVWQVGLIVLVLCLLAAALYRRFDPKRIIIVATAGLIVFVLGGTVLALQFASILLPTTALLLSQGLVAGLAIYRNEIWQDRYLSRQVDRAVSVAFRRGSFDNQARLPEILLGSANVLGMRNMLLIEQSEVGKLIELGVINATLKDLSEDRKLIDAFFRKARNSNRPCDASALSPTWEGPVWLAWLGGAERDIYWLYSMAGIAKRQRGERLAAAMISSYRQLQRLRASLSSGTERRSNIQSIDDRVTNALDLITGHDEQIRNGLDALDTAVMVFHLLGYPLHANARMSQLSDDAKLSLIDVTLSEVLLHLTELDAERIAVMLHELLFRGGELRVPCRPLAARTMVLRIAAPFRVGRGNERVIVLEAIEITNLKRLADLRLAVSNYIDTQLRNDLTAIALGASFAADTRLERPAVTRAIALIAQATTRATDRLESVAALMQDQTDNVLNLAYPIDAGNVARLAIAKVQALANDLQVSIDATIPASGGYTIAEPESLEAMLGAILRIMIAETQPTDAVQLQVLEVDDFTRIRLVGGFGVSFESLCAALDTPDAGALPEYRAIADGMKQALGWKANVSYWSDIGKGYRFNIELRRVI